MVQHNHVIVEKEIRYVRRIPITTTVNFVTDNYRVMERPAAVSIPVVPRRNYECGWDLAAIRARAGLGSAFAASFEIKRYAGGRNELSRPARKS